MTRRVSFSNFRTDAKCHGSITSTKLGISHLRIQWNLISSVLNSNNLEVCSRAEIKQELMQCHSHLFLSKLTDACCKQTCFASIENHLSFAQQQSCEGILSLQESRTDSFKTLTLGKSPSSDGFLVKFYLHFWEILAPVYSALQTNVFMTVIYVTL